MVMQHAAAATAAGVTWAGHHAAAKADIQRERERVIFTRQNTRLRNITRIS